MRKNIGKGRGNGRGMGSRGSISPRGTKRGACGKMPKRDGSGKGRGNRR